MSDRSPTSIRNLRAAIVGAGLMGRWHADAICRVGGTVAAIVDRDADRASRLAKRFSGARVATRLSEILNADLADAVHVCTPANTHESLAQEALEFGRHALIEKPLTEAAEATNRLLQFAESKGVLLCPVHQMLFQRGVRRIEGAITGIGPLLHIETVICSAGAEGDPENADLVVADILPGPLSLIAKFAPSPIRDVAWKVERPALGELRATASAEGVSISLLVSMSGRPTLNSLRMIGERGTAYADLFHGFSIIERGTVSRARKITNPFTQGGAILYSAAANLLTRASRRESAYPGLRELIRQFYEAIIAGSAPPIGAKETMDVALARAHILRRAGRNS